MTKNCIVKIRLTSILLFLSIFILHLLNLSDFEAQPGEDRINDEKEEQISELVEFIEWSEFVTQYLQVGNVKTLVFDPDGVVKIVLRKPAEYQM